MSPATTRAALPRRQGVRRKSWVTSGKSRVSTNNFEEFAGTKPWHYSYRTMTFFRSLKAPASIWSCISLSRYGPRSAEAPVMFHISIHFVHYFGDREKRWRGDCCVALATTMLYITNIAGIRATSREATMQSGLTNEVCTNPVFWSKFVEVI